MSQSHEVDEDTNMAISYTTQSSTGHPHQTLPSFRELLPAHLHDEIESTSPFYTPRHSQDRPLLSHEMADPRSIPYGNPSNQIPYDSHREYTVSRSADHHMHLPETASRGPSPILPPIRDLDSIPGRALNPSSNGFPERVPRSDPFVTQEFRQPGPAGAAMSADPRGEHFVQPTLHPQSPFGHHSIGYADEQMSPQMMGHGQGNFGIMGDPIDPKTKRRRGNLPKPVTDILRAWFHEHLDHPYPSEEDKQMFMTRTGLSISQISNWFINARRRQLPALRNQMRSGADTESQRQSPFSDVDGSERMPSPHH
ncbi:Homeobox transcription factor, putative [Penicillium digitatum]|uniref:Homeobox transcription factor, putative n=1 Tax=Penicillium digitatum TaxID=36651 RepID=A0A7T7BK94_PENDI|nr:Homeobox transcription factor, putative [Penicillium digitatum]